MMSSLRTLTNSLYYILQNSNCVLWQRPRVIYINISLLESKLGCWWPDQKVTPRSLAVLKLWPFDYVRADIKISLRSISKHTLTKLFVCHVIVLKNVYNLVWPLPEGKWERKSWDSCSCTSRYWTGAPPKWSSRSTERMAAAPDSSWPMKSQKSNHFLNFWNCFRVYFVYFMFLYVIWQEFLNRNFEKVVGFYVGWREKWRLKK